MMKNDNCKVAQILLVEDNFDDVLIMKKGIDNMGVKVDLHHVKNGVECMNFLHKEGCYINSPIPDIIILDLNLPKLNGKEVMKKISSDPDLKKLPVIALSTSAAQQDIVEMYQLRCSSYIKKPIDYNQFKNIVKEIYNYWFKIVMLPRENI